MPMAAIAFSEREIEMGRQIDRDIEVGGRLTPVQKLLLAVCIQSYHSILISDNAIPWQCPIHA